MFTQVIMTSTADNSEEDVILNIEKKNYKYYWYVDKDDTTKLQKGQSCQWMVPKKISLPKVDLKTGWRL